MTTLQQLSLTDDGKFYLLGDRKLTRVTTITDILPKPALVPWAEKIGRDAVLRIYGREGRLPDYMNPEAHAILTEKARERGLDCDSLKNSGGDRGSAMHEVFGQLGRGEEPSYPPDCEPYVQSLKAFFDAYLPVVQESEVVVWHEELGYAGRFDALLKTGQHPPRRRHEHLEHRRGLWDLKTNASGRAYKPAHPAQVLLYSMAREAMGLEPVDYEAVLAIGPAEDGKPNFSVTVNQLPKSFGEALVALYREMENAKA